MQPTRSIKVLFPNYLLKNNCIMQKIILNLVNDAKENVEEGFGICGMLLIGISYVIFFLTFPISIFLSVKIVSG